MDGAPSPSAIVRSTLAEPSNSNASRGSDSGSNARGGDSGGKNDGINDDVTDGNSRAVPDDWPMAHDGSEWDGTRLLDLTRRGEGPFRTAWDVDAFVAEVEQILKAKVVDIPAVSRGANHYGLHVQLDNRPDVVARLSRHDVNTPGVHGSELEGTQRQLSRFELATYDALQTLAASSLPHAQVFGGRPLHHRDPVAWPSPGVTPPSPPCLMEALMSRPAVCRTIIGRGLFLFEKASGQGYDYVRWRALSPAQKNFLLAQSAQAAATLFEYWLPAEYAWTWLPVRLAELQQRQASRDVAPTRDFCEYMMHARIDFALARFAPRALDLFSRVATVRGILHWLVPRVLPHAGNGLSEAALYRLVLDHGDFGMHNMTIATDKRGWPWITSVYDWEGASIVPAVLSEPKMVVTADLVLDDEGEPTVSRWGDGDSLPRMDEYLGWSREYYRELFRQSPEYQRVIEASKDARIIWFAMRGLETAEPGALFSRLYEWAKQQTTG